MVKGRIEFANRWMFNKIMCKEEVCRRVLGAALGIEVGRITYLNAEQAVEPTLTGRGVRMDIYAKDDKRIYDVEMQVARDARLGRRMRYYQSAMDAGELDAGRPYDALPDSYVVFLCCFDAYGEGEPVYRIERRCVGHLKVDIGDGSPWVVLNATAWERAESRPLRDLLRYALTGETDGELSRVIDGYVSEYNRDRKWVSHVLTLEQDIEIRCGWAREEGFEQGIEQGIEQGATLFGALVERLVELGRIDDIALAARDAEARQRLFGEFGL